jgi:hypothetical protein
MPHRPCDATGAGRTDDAQRVARPRLAHVRAGGHERSQRRPSDGLNSQGDGDDGGGEGRLAATETHGDEGGVVSPTICEEWRRPGAQRWEVKMLSSRFAVDGAVTCGGAVGLQLAVAAGGAQFVRKGNLVQSSGPASQQ